MKNNWLQNFQTVIIINFVSSESFALDSTKLDSIFNFSKSKSSQVKRVIDPVMEAVFNQTISSKNFVSGHVLPVSFCLVRCPCHQRNDQIFFVFNLRKFRVVSLFSGLKVHLINAHCSPIKVPFMKMAMNNS